MGDSPAHREEQELLTCNGILARAVTYFQWTPSSMMYLCSCTDPHQHQELPERKSCSNGITAFCPKQSPRNPPPTLHPVNAAVPASCRLSQPPHWVDKGFEFRFFLCFAFAYFLPYPCPPSTRAELPPPHPSSDPLARSGAPTTPARSRARQLAIEYEASEQKSSIPPQWRLSASWYVILGRPRSPSSRSPSANPTLIAEREPGAIAHGGRSNSAGLLDPDTLPLSPRPAKIIRVECQR